MNLHTIDTGYFKLDGGAMFGVVPKTLWNRHNPADEKNLCNWAMRCLLIEDGDKLILIDTGLGDKQDEKFFGFYDLNGDATLLDSIKKAGFSAEDVTDVVLTHLHFDHVGGAVKYNSNKSLLQPTFPKATYWSNEAHWQWATNPNPREKASFLKENILPIKESGQLKFIEKGISPFSQYRFHPCRRTYGTNDVARYFLQKPEDHLRGRFNSIFLSFTTSLGNELRRQTVSNDG